LTGKIFTYLPASRFTRSQKTAEPFGVGKPLFGALKGELSYHFGRKPEYRIIYFIENDLIVVTIIGSRENIYKRARRRTIGQR